MMLTLLDMSSYISSMSWIFVVAALPLRRPSSEYTSSSSPPACLNHPTGSAVKGVHACGGFPLSRCHVDSSNASSDISTSRKVGLQWGSGCLHELREYLHGNIMFSCFHVIKLHESICFHVFSPFNAHFSPQTWCNGDAKVMNYISQCLQLHRAILVWAFIIGTTILRMLYDSCPAYQHCVISS